MGLDDTEDSAPTTEAQSSISSEIVEPQISSGDAELLPQEGSAEPPSPELDDGGYNVPEDANDGEGNADEANVVDTPFVEGEDNAATGQVNPNAGEKNAQEVPAVKVAGNNPVGHKGGRRGPKRGPPRDADVSREFPQGLPSGYKTQACKFFRQGGKCARGKDCLYLHPGEKSNDVKGIHGQPAFDHQAAQGNAKEQVRDKARDPVRDALPRDVRDARNLLREPALPNKAMLQRPLEEDWARGDWECRHCNTHNFSRNMACFKCQAPNPRAPPRRNMLWKLEEDLREAEMGMKICGEDGRLAAQDRFAAARAALWRARERERGPPPGDFRGRGRSPPRDFPMMMRERRGGRGDSPPRPHERGYRERSPRRDFPPWDGRGGGGGYGRDFYRDEPMAPMAQMPFGFRENYREPQPGPYREHAPGPYREERREERREEGRWEEARDEHGDVYYWHTITKETRWKDPKMQASLSQQQPLSAPSPIVPQATSSEWEAVVDAKGETYYWNTVTGVTQWDPPAGFSERGKPPVRYGRI